jgi:hypothetical protein
MSKLTSTNINESTNISLGCQVDRLEGRRSVLGGPDAMMAHSATVKKDDGKWKVDTSYIGPGPQTEKNATGGP